MKTLRARWILPGDGPPLEGAYLSWHDDRITRLASTKPDGAFVDLGDVVLTPGLVNAHTHLDLSGAAELAGSAQPGSFIAWLARVIHYRRSTTPTDWQQGIAEGIMQCECVGTTLVGDISTGGWSTAFLAQSSLRSVVFHELLGLTQARAEQTWAAASNWLNEATNSDRCTLALSPHAPYTTRRTLFQKGATAEVPIAIHVAETCEELELQRNRSGPLRSFLESLGAWDDSDLLTSLDELAELFRGQRVLWIHGNYLPTDSPLLIHPRASVVYCPRTHHAFGHTRHPVAEFLAKGINVALGTDSLASNPDLSVLEEMRFLARHRPDLAPEQILRLGTWNGARALGYDDLGRLRPGSAADWLWFPALSHDPFESVLANMVPPTVCRGGRTANSTVEQV